MFYNEYSVLMKTQLKIMFIGSYNIIKNVTYIFLIF